MTRPDAPSGRGRTLRRSPVGALADEAGVPGAHPRAPARPAFLAALRELAPDCCPVVAYGALVPRAALDVPAHGWVNLHFSLLPAWRGAAPVQAALRHGDDITGATTFLLEEGLDTGPVFGVVTEAVRADDTAGALLAPARRLRAPRCSRPRSTASPTAASPRARSRRTGVSHAPKVTVADARVDWAAPPTPIDRLVRSVTPEPGAWTTFRDERLGHRPGATGRGRPRAEARRAARREAARARRHRRRTARSSARCGPSASARCPRPTGPAACASSPASCCDDPRGSGAAARRARAAAGHRAGAPAPPVRRRSTRPGSRRWSCSPRCGCATRTPTSPCPRSCAATGCATATRRWPPSWATAPCAPAACSTP